MEKLLILALWVLTILAAGFIGYLGAYLKKKGENLATHEDLDKLVEQVRAVTTTTREIEAKISTDVWDRQKRWEMKRDVLFEATKRLGVVEDTLIGLESAYRVPLALKEKAQAGARWTSALRRFKETCLLMGIVCRDEVMNACDDYRRFARQVGMGIFKEDKEVYDKSIPELAKKSSAAMDAIRKELEIDKTT